MARLDLHSLVITSVAVTAALTTGWWMNHLDGRGQARAASITLPAVHAAPASPAVARISVAADGHYWADADIQGCTVKVLIDTGATVVALTREDARKLGFDLAPEEFNRPVQTASGPTQAATVRLRHVSVAGVRIADVEALVVRDGLTHSLLGMSYLGRLSKFEATPRELTLRL